jgi:D-sedoheptulose 7-phosphate isomerase
MSVQEISSDIIKCFKSGHKVLIAGNGGSAGEAQHLAGEFVGKFKYLRRALPAIALTTDTSIITAIANDYGFENIFTRQLEALAKPGDILITLSTSGKSKNILKAIEWSKEHRVKVIDLDRIGNDTPERQENHLWMIHKIAGIVEEAFI